MIREWLEFWGFKADRVTEARRHDDERPMRRLLHRARGQAVLR